MNSVLVHLAVQMANQDIETEIGILKSTTDILRKHSLEFLKGRKCATIIKRIFQMDFSR